MDEERLIMLVSYHEEIFNSSNPQYNNLEKKEMCWRRIAEVLGQPVYKCKDKWANLRGSYRRAIKKRFAAHIQGAESIPPWRFESQMEFLRPYLKPREYLSIKDAAELKHDGDGCIYLDSALEYSDSEILQPLADKISSTTEKTTESHRSTDGGNGAHGHNNDAASASRKRRSSYSYEDSFDPVAGAAAIASGVSRTHDMSERDRDRDRDVTLDFFINMANTVKSFPPKLQTEVKYRVFQLVNAAEYTMHESCRANQNDVNGGMTVAGGAAGAPSSSPSVSLKEPQPNSHRQASPVQSSAITTPPYQSESINSLNVSSP